jgi:hypothetical protein
MFSASTLNRCEDALNVPNDVRILLISKDRTKQAAALYMIRESIALDATAAPWTLLRRDP